MADKIIAPLAIVLFLVFVSFLAVFVNEIDLWIVIGSVCVMAIYDFWATLRQSNNGNGNAKP